MRTDNKGFTLTELLVSVVIFGVVLAAAFGFMLASTKSYNRVNDRIEVQTKSQMALNLVAEYVIDCTGGLCFDADADTLYIFGTPYISGGNTICDVDIFRLNTTDKILEYAETTATQGTIDEDGVIHYAADAPAEYYEVARKVVDFDVVTPDYTAEKVSYTVNTTIGMMQRSANYMGEMRTALRNKPPQVVIS